MLPIDPGDGQGRYLPGGRWPPAPPKARPMMAKAVMVSGARPSPRSLCETSPRRGR